MGKAKRRLYLLQSAISVNCLDYNNNKKSEVLIVFVTISNEKSEASTKQWEKRIKRRMSWLQSAISVNCLVYNNNKESEVSIAFVTISNKKSELSIVLVAKINENSKCQLSCMQ